MKKQLFTIVLTAIVTFFGYLAFDKIATPAATVIEEVAGTELLSGMLETPDVAHPAMGGFKVIATEGGMRSIMFDDMFAIAHAPDPHVRINGMVIAKVVNYEGAQAYPIPNFIDEDIMSVHIWCEIADISLGNGMFEGMEMPMDMDMPKEDMDMPIEFQNMPEEGMPEELKKDK